MTPDGQKRKNQLLWGCGLTTCSVLHVTFTINVALSLVWQS